MCWPLSRRSQPRRRHSTRLRVMFNCRGWGGQGSAGIQGGGPGGAAKHPRRQRTPLTTKTHPAQLPRMLSLETPNCKGKVNSQDRHLDHTETRAQGAKRRLPASDTPASAATAPLWEQTLLSLLKSIFIVNIHSLEKKKRLNAPHNLPRETIFCCFRNAITFSINSSKMKNT